MEIYVVFKNADFTEGRGPMQFHLAFTDGEEAIRYVEKQQGIYGSPQRVERGKYGHFAYGNGYEIDKVVVHRSVAEVIRNQKEEARKKALAKLTEEEIELLGLEK